MKKPSPHYVSEGDYFVTITLRPELYGKSARSQRKHTLSPLSKILDCYFRRYFYVTELTKQGVVHYHITGIFKEMDYLKDIFIDDMKGHKTFGFLKINDEKVLKENTERTFNYLTKDIDKTNAIINRSFKNVILPIWEYRQNTIILQAKSKLATFFLDLAIDN